VKSRQLKDRLNIALAEMEKVAEVRTNSKGGGGGFGGKKYRKPESFLPPPPPPHPLLPLTYKRTGFKNEKKIFLGISKNRGGGGKKEIFGTL